MGKRIKKHNVISRLPDALRETVEQMILSNGVTYSDIVDYLKDKGVALTPSTVCRYAQDFHANMQTLQIAQENFRRMMETMDKYPTLDTTEAIVRVTSQHIFQRLANATPQELADVPLHKLISETNALIRAVAYKRRTDIQNEDALHVGLDKVKAILFDTMARENPELYKQVTAFINTVKDTGKLEATP